jgi:putative ABC transport system substrate-binding protein
MATCRARAGNWAALSHCDLGASEIGKLPRRAWANRICGEGRNLDIDGRGLGVAAASYETVAVELIEARPDVLMVAGPEAARAAQKATQRIPIVALADDLLGSKLVASMPHPDGNTTGVAIFAFQLDVKRLELLREALPGARRIAVFADHEPIRNIRDLESAARGFGIEIVPFLRGLRKKSSGR